MKRLFSVFMALALVSTSGCYQIHYRTRAPSTGSPEAELWHHSFVAGLIEGSAPVDISGICPGGFAEVDREVSFVNWLSSYLVNSAVSTSIYLATSRGGRRMGIPLPFTLWTPKTVRVTCARPSPLGPPP